MPAPLDLTAVPWIGAILAEDPLLSGAQVALAATESRADQIFSAKGLPGLFGDPAPDSLARPGLSAATGAGQGDRVLYQPLEPPRDVMVRCQIIAPGEGLCEMMATYAPDAHILPSAVWSGPLPRDLAHLRAVADRIREVAGCLDVTGRVPADPAARLAELRAANPRLEDCTEALLS